MTSLKYGQDVPLKYTWNFYDHIKSDKNNYENCTNKTGTCSTLFEFWTCYEKLPKPSDMFYQKGKSTKPHYFQDNIKREVSALSLFRDPIAPKWEDPANKNGGEIEYRLKQDSDIDILDKMWLQLSVNCLSGNYLDTVTGFRIVDSSVFEDVDQVKKGKNTSKALYRVEVWFDDFNSAKNVENIFRKLFELHNLNVHKINIKKHNCL